MNIEEGNKIIAEFMGIETKVYSDTPTITHWRFNNSMLRVSDMKYHLLWDWLMPVVEKIEGMGYDSRIHTIDSESTYFVDFVDVVNENTEVACISKSYHEASKIQTVWLAVVEFVKAEINNVKVEK